MSIRLIAKDQSTVKFTLRDSGNGNALVNLTGCSVALLLRRGAEAPASVSMTIMDPLAGTVFYKFLPADLKPGVMQAVVQMTDAGGGIITQLNPFVWEVRASAFIG